MEFEEALVHLKNGRKIRNVNWDAHEYISVGTWGHIFDEKGNKYGIVNDQMFYEWELYKEEGKDVLKLVEEESELGLEELVEKIYCVDERTTRLERSFKAFEEVIKHSKLNERISLSKIIELDEGIMKLQNFMPDVLLDNERRVTKLEERIRLLEKR